MKRFALPFTAAAAAAAVLIAGCSSSGGSKPPAGGGSGQTASSGGGGGGATGAPIVVGMICSCSGALPQPVTQHTIEAWASWTNANGGLNGHPVKVIVKDDNLNAATSLQDVKELVEQDHVMAIVGETSDLDGEWASYVQSKGVPVVGGASYEAPFTTNPDFFASATNVPTLTVGLYKKVKELGGKHFGSMYCAESPACAQSGQLEQSIFKVMGGDVKLTVQSVASTLPNYNAQCLAFKNAGVDTFQVANAGAIVIRITDNCAQLGYKPKLVNLSPEYTKAYLSDPNMDGISFIAPTANFTDQTIPGVKDYTDALSKYAPDVLNSPQFSYVNFNSWVGGQLFAAAAKAGKLSPTSTPADVKAALYSLKDETLGGLVPPLNFTKDKASITPCYFVQQVKGGKLTTVSGKPICLSTAEQATLAKALGG